MESRFEQFECYRYDNQRNKLIAKGLCASNPTFSDCRRDFSDSAKKAVYLLGEKKEKKNCQVEIIKKKKIHKCRMENCIQVDSTDKTEMK